VFSQMAQQKHDYCSQPDSVQSEGTAATWLLQSAGQCSVRTHSRNMTTAVRRTVFSQKAQQKHDYCSQPDSVQSEGTAATWLLQSAGQCSVKAYLLQTKNPLQAQWQPCVSMLLVAAFKEYRTLYRLGFKSRLEHRCDVCCLGVVKLWGLTLSDQQARPHTYFPLT
jgi:hypothetical protein